MAQEILCEVNNCKFWNSGDRCSAKSIYVVSQKGKRAKSSEETDCKTFTPRDQYMILLKNPKRSCFMAFFWDFL